MAEVTGPISTLPGASHEFPEGTVCDNHPDRPATARVQGETDSMGCEMHDFCDECAKEHRDERRQERLGECDWCDAKEVPLVDARDYEEGMSGRVYSVCQRCKDRQAARLDDELYRYGDYND